jgi:hypothetical protein
MAYEVLIMTNIDIRITNEKPEILLDDSDIFLKGSPLIVLHYSGFQLYLSQTAVLQLKQSLKCGEGMLENHRRFMETANNLPLPFC